MSDAQFGVVHYAGAVMYDSAGFLEKSKDALQSNIGKIMTASTSQVCGTRRRLECPVCLMGTV